MGEILKILLFAPLQTEAHFLFERITGVQLDGEQRLAIFPKLSEVHFY